MTRTSVGGRRTFQRVNHCHSTRLDTPNKAETAVKLIDEKSLQAFWIRVCLHVELRAAVSIPPRLTRLLSPQTRDTLTVKEKKYTTKTRNNYTRLFTFTIFTTHNSDHNQ